MFCVADLFAQMLKRSLDEEHQGALTLKTL